MANHLRVAMIHAIVTLHQRGWSNRRIARELGVDRGAVARHLAGVAEANVATGGENPPPGSDAVPAGAADSKPATPEANPPLGSDADLTSVSEPPEPPEHAAKAAINPPLGSEGGLAAVVAGPPSTCEPYRNCIEEKIAQGLSGRRIYQDLVQEHGDDGAPSYDSIKRFLRHLRRETPVPFRRMESPPGQEAQIDFGSGATVVGADGKRRRTHVFRVVLSHSRKGYSQAVFHQTTEDFIACLENAFHHFGGVPKTLVIDNLRAAVKQPDWYDPELVPRLEAFCRHYGTVILPTRSYTPRHKGKIERGIGYVKDNALKGRTFTNLQEQNQHLAQWEQSVADTRIHGTTRKQVGKVFHEIERATLLPLPAERFPFFHEALRTVHRDGHVAVAQAYYSVPPEYVGRQVQVRWDAHLVKIFNHRHEQIAIHAREQAGRFATNQAHLHPHKTSTVERGTSYLLQQAALLGSNVATWSQAMLQNRGVEGVRVLVGLLSIAREQPGCDLERACRIAHSHHAYRLRAIRELLKTPDPVGEQEAFEFTASHPIIRELHEYDALVRDALRGMEPTIHAEAS
ncbi:MAG: IS21 family transposase [Phycisphaerae bacterium]